MISVIQLLGGKGTRLKNITKGNLPKPLVKLNDLSLLEEQVKHLLSYGCKDFIWICHFRTELFEQEKKVLLKKYKGLINTIEIYKEIQPLSTFGSIRNSIKNNNSEEFLVLYGDILIGFNLYKFVNDFKKFEKSDTHIITRFSDHPQDSDKIAINEEGFITNFYSKNETFNIIHPSTTTSGIYIAKKSFFDKLEHWSGQSCDLYSEVLPIDSYLIKATAYLSTEYFLDIGTEERLRKAKKDLNSKTILRKSYSFSQPALLLDRDGVLIKEDGHLIDVEKIIYNEELIAVMKYLKAKGVLIGIITNQPHIAQGRINGYSHLSITNAIIRNLCNQNALDFYYECKHYPIGGFSDEVSYYKKNCSCRKPRSGLIQKAINSHNIDIERSLFVGNNSSDINAGEICNLKSFYYSFPKSEKLKEYRNLIQNPKQLLDYFKVLKTNE